MAKKFVRGVTGVDDIEKFDKSLTNVNDIISDGQDTYVHTKKGKTESYYKLTGSLKSLQSNDSGLITVTKDDTNGTVTIHPKHDTQKEQSLESTRSTVTIQKGANGTSETTKVDTNPQKVLEHDKLKTGDGLATLFNTDKTTIIFKPTKKPANTNLNNLDDGVIWGVGFNEEQLPNRDKFNPASFITIQTDTNKKVQLYIRESSVTPAKIVMFYRFIKDGEVTVWKQMAVDNDELLEHLAKKQNNLTSNTSIGVLPNNTLRQLFFYMKTYTQQEGVLRTHMKDVSRPGYETSKEDEFNFILKINQGHQEATFTLQPEDKTKFSNIITTYGTGNAVRINGCLFSLSGSTLTVTTEANTENNYVITFSDII